MKGCYNILIVLHCIALRYTLSNFIVVSATFTLLLASLGGRMTESLNHREAKEVLSIALPFLFVFFK